MADRRSPGCVRSAGRRWYDSAPELAGPGAGYAVGPRTGRHMVILADLDFLYTPSRDVARDMADLVDGFGARVIFAIEDSGVRVAMLQLTDHPPRILFTDHVDGDRPILVYRVDDHAAATAELRAPRLDAGNLAGDPAGAGQLVPVAGRAPDRRLPVHSPRRPGPLRRSARLLDRPGRGRAGAADGEGESEHPRIIEEPFLPDALGGRRPRRSGPWRDGGSAGPAVPGGQRDPSTGSCTKAYRSMHSRLSRAGLSPRPSSAGRDTGRDHRSERRPKPSRRSPRGRRGRHRRERMSPSRSRRRGPADGAGPGPCPGRWSSRGPSGRASVPHPCRGRRTGRRARGRTGSRRAALSSTMAASCDIARLYGRSWVIASYASAMATIRAPSGISSRAGRTG